MVGLKPYRKNGLKNFSKQSVMIFKNDIRCTILYTIFIRTRARKQIVADIESEDFIKNAYVF